MEEHLLNQWYMAPLWAASAWNLYKIAYSNYKSAKEDGGGFLYTIGLSVGSICSAGMAVICANKGLEQLLG